MPVKKGQKLKQNPESIKVVANLESGGLQAQRRIEEYIRFYNEERAQRKLNKLTPVEYRRQLAS